MTKSALQRAEAILNAHILQRDNESGRVNTLQERIAAEFEILDNMRKLLANHNAELERQLTHLNAHDKSRVNCLLKVDELERNLSVAINALKDYRGIAGNSCKGITGYSIADEALAEIEGGEK